MLLKIILFVTSKQVTAGRWRLGKLMACEDFSNDEAGHDQFRLYLSKHPNIPVHMIVDAVEEDFRLETMPHTFGRSRTEMVGRKLNQLYRNTSYRTSQFVGRETDKRRDDRFLFMGLTNPDLLAPWVSTIEDLQAPLAGIYLKPSVSQLLVKSLKLKDADLLLMTRQSAGMRQTYFSNQLLRVSRLTPLVGMDHQQIEKLYVTETEKTRLYLISLRMMSRESRLHVVFPSTEPVGDEVISQLESGQNVSCTIIGPQALARIIGIDLTWLQRFPDLMHMQVLASQQCPGNLAPASQLRQYKLHNLRNGINLTSAAIVVGALTVAGFNILSAIDQHRQIQDTIAQTQQQDRLYNEVSSNFPKTPRPGSDLKIAVDLADKIKEVSRDPQRLMQVVSTALDSQHEIELVRLRWKLTEDANASDDDSSTSNAPANGNVPPAPTGLYEIGFIEGEISNFTGDYRAAIDSMNRLVEVLKQNTTVEQVAILQQPVNTSSLASLQGSTLDQQAQQLPAARFKLKVILKPEAVK
jgi:hypothetical protein